MVPHVWQGRLLRKCDAEQQTDHDPCCLFFFLSCMEMSVSKVLKTRFKKTDSQLIRMGLLCKSRGMGRAGMKED